MIMDNSTASNARLRMDTIDPTPSATPPIVGAFFRRRTSKIGSRISVPASADDYDIWTGGDLSPSHVAHDELVQLRGMTTAATADGDGVKPRQPVVVVVQHEPRVVENLDRGQQSLTRSVTTNPTGATARVEAAMFGYSMSQSMGMSPALGGMSPAGGRNISSGSMSSSPGMSGMAGRTTGSGGAVMSAAGSGGWRDPVPAPGRGMGAPGGGGGGGGMSVRSAAATPDGVRINLDVSPSSPTTTTAQRQRRLLPPTIPRPKDAYDARFAAGDLAGLA